MLQGAGLKVNGGRLNIDNTNVYDNEAGAVRWAYSGLLMLMSHLDAVRVLLSLSQRAGDSLWCVWRR